MINERKWIALRERMARLGIRDADLDEQFVRSGGHGGQNVNKVASCVMLHHAPSGVRVKCQMTRTQGENRYLARKILCEKIEERILGARSAAARERARIRAQKRKRSRRAKEKMLADKKRRGEQRRNRSFAGEDA